MLWSSTGYHQATTAVTLCSIDTQCKLNKDKVQNKSQMDGTEQFWVSEWVSEWLSLTAFLGTEDIGVHVVYTSRVFIAYTLESLSSLT